MSVATEVERTSRSETTLDLRTPEAFRAVAIEHRGALYRVALRLLGDAHAAEDVVQEALTRAFAARAGYRGDARPLTWLCGYVVNLCRAEARRRRVRRWLSFVVSPAEPDLTEPAAPAAEDALEARERGAALRDALAALPEGQRAALALVVQEGLSAREAALALSTTEAAVWQAVSRARRALRDALPEEDA